MQIIAQNNNCCYVVLPDTMKYLDRNQSSISQRIKIIDYVDALSNYNIKFRVEVEGSNDGPLNVTLNNAH
ncbi:hypothetical protein T06_11180 [Trichinella sp. T6]|nr:hypothetical protein T06_11180 [Trichinella sp. T6]